MDRRIGDWGNADVAWEIGATRTLLGRLGQRGRCLGDWRLGIQGVGHVLESHVGGHLEEMLELLTPEDQVGTGFGLQDTDLGLPVQVVAGECRFGGDGMFLQDHVGVDASESEGIDARTPWRVVPAVDPRTGLSVNVERRLLQLQPGVGLVHVEGGRQHLVIERQSCLDQPGYASGRHGVPDHGLDRA